MDYRVIVCHVPKIQLDDPRGLGMSEGWTEEAKRGFGVGETPVAGLRCDATDESFMDSERL
jgi:hypothetical protein